MVLLVYGVLGGGQQVGNLWGDAVAKNREGTGEEKRTQDCVIHNRFVGLGYDMGAEVGG
jgi:hypothetical protein